MSQVHLQVKVVFHQSTRQSWSFPFLSFHRREIQTDISPSSTWVGCLYTRPYYRTSPFQHKCVKENKNNSKEKFFFFFFSGSIRETPYGKRRRKVLNIYFVGTWALLWLFTRLASVYVMITQLLLIREKKKRGKPSCAVCICICIDIERMIFHLSLGRIMWLANPFRKNSYVAIRERPKNRSVYSSSG